MSSTVVRILLLVSSAATLASATTFGVPDQNGHPYVGTLLFQASDHYFYSCSGTLLSPTVFVTAAHCTTDAGGKNLYSWVTFAPAISFENRSKYKSLKAYLDDRKNGWIAADVYPHPLYRGVYPNTYDIGVAVLKSPVDLPAYGVLPPKWFLDSIKTPAENLFTVVGYGMEGYIKPFYEDNWERRVSNTRLVELKSTFDGADMSAKFTNNPGNVSGGSCYGDSGGPVFYQSTNMITAIVSWGITPCIGVDYNFRIDTPVAQDFLATFLNR